MGADVAHRPQRPAEARDEAPVPVGLEEQPVLEVVPAHQAHVAHAAVAHEVADMLVERVEADVEVHRVHATRSRGQVDQLARLVRGHGQRLLAHHVATCRKDLRDLWMVEVVRRGDVDDLHPIVVEEVGQRGIRPGHADAFGAGGASLGGRAEQPMHLHAHASQCLDVDGADEAAADDGGPDIARSPHPAPAGVAGWPDGGWAGPHGSARENCTN